MKSPLFHCGYEAEYLSPMWALGTSLGSLWWQHFLAGNQESFGQLV